MTNPSAPYPYPALWSRPLTPGYGRIGVTRAAFAECRVTVLGPVQFEPGMVRVRRATGEVHRALIENIKAEADVQTPAGGRAGHVALAAHLVERFTAPEPPPAPDNTPAGRLARLLDARDEYAARAELTAATIADMQAIAVAARWGGWSSGWKRARWVTHLVQDAMRERDRRDAASTDPAALRNAYERVTKEAARADGPAPARGDARPRVETFRGRKLRTQRGQEWGTVVCLINGESAGSTANGWDPAALDNAAQQLRRDVIGADERCITEPDAYPAHWFAGAPDPHPVVAAYVRHRARREEQDRQAIAAPASHPKVAAVSTTNPDEVHAGRLTGVRGPFAPAYAPVCGVGGFPAHGSPTSRAVNCSTCLRRHAGTVETITRAQVSTPPNLADATRDSERDAWNAAVDSGDPDQVASVRARTLRAVAERVMNDDPRAHAAGCKPTNDQATAPALSGWAGLDL